MIVPGDTMGTLEGRGIFGMGSVGLALDWDVSLEEDIIVQYKKNPVCESTLQLLVQSDSKSKPPSAQSTSLAANY